MEMPKEERRKFPRLKTELFVRYKIINPPDEGLEGRTRNIGGGGICLVTREKIKPGTMLAMEIKFPYAVNPVLIKGRTVWTGESSLGLSPAGHVQYDNGVEFLEITEENRQQIIEHVNDERQKQGLKEWKIGIARDLPE